MGRCLQSTCAQHREGEAGDPGLSPCAWAPQQKPHTLRNVGQDWGENSVSPQLQGQANLVPSSPLLPFRVLLLL